MTTVTEQQPNQPPPDESAAEPETTTGFPLPQLPVLIEALLFVSDGPIEETTLARTLGVTRRQIDGPLNALAESLRGRGIRLQRGPDGVQLVTAPLAATVVEQFLGIEAGRRLSTAALETLAIIAYRQPVTRAGLEGIRGVNCDGALDTLRARGLVDAAGRAETPGRPVLFATTQKFLEYFGLERPEDLPALPEVIADLAAALPERALQLPLGHVEQTGQPGQPAAFVSASPPVVVEGVEGVEVAQGAAAVALRERRAGGAARALFAAASLALPSSAPRIATPVTLGVTLRGGLSGAPRL